MLANLLLILRGTGRSAELLLPRLNSNHAGLTIAGADPSFSPGRGPVNGVPGARTHEELRARLRDSKIRAALVIGEDPLEHGRTGAWFENVDYLVAADWCETETTRFADIALPMTTYLESEGTRCNFEGRVLDFSRATPPPAGLPGWQVLAGIARACAVRVTASSAAELTREIETQIRVNLHAMAPFYWNRGEKREWPARGRLVIPELHARPASIPPALTHSGRYKRAIREVGTARYRVH
jgi:anaerobic selenocysteine-containing dehydrogenase